MAAMSTISVMYKCIDGVHFFVTTDKDAAGLCVANNDPAVAYAEVAHQLNALFKFNHNKECNFVPAVPFEAMKKQMEAAQLLAKGFEQSGMMMAATIQPWIAEQAKQ
jgi:hypothetical protein